MKRTEWIVETGSYRKTLRGARKRPGAPYPRRPEPQSRTAPVSDRRSGVSRVQKLRSKGCSAAAASCCIWILKSEPRTHHAGHVVDLDAVQILGAEHVDEKAHAFLVEDVITLARLFFNVQAVLESRAAAGNNANPKSGRLGQAFFGGHESFDFARCRLGDIKCHIRGGDDARRLSLSSCCGHFISTPFQCFRLSIADLPTLPLWLAPNWQSQIHVTDLFPKRQVRVSWLRLRPVWLLLRLPDEKPVIALNPAGLPRPELLYRLLRALPCPAGSRPEKERRTCRLVSVRRPRQRCCSECPYRERQSSSCFPRCRAQVRPQFRTFARRGAHPQPPLPEVS